jgi:hypothetical protein
MVCMAHCWALLVHRLHQVARCALHVHGLQVSGTVLGQRFARQSEACPGVCVCLVAASCQGADCAQLLHPLCIKCMLHACFRAVIDAA